MVEAVRVSDADCGPRKWGQGFRDLAPSNLSGNRTSQHRDLFWWQV